MMLIFRTLLIFSSTLISACSLTPSAEPISTFTLNSATTKTHINNDTTLKLSLRINKPNASGFLASNRMLVVKDLQELSLYKGAQWNEATPLLVRNHLFDYFRQSNALAFVTSDDKRLAASIELDSDLRAFQLVNHPDKPFVIITLVVRLVEANNKRIIASQTFTQQIDTNKNDLTMVVSAFSQAQNNLAGSVLEWSIKTLSHPY